MGVGNRVTFMDEGRGVENGVDALGAASIGVLGRHGRGGGEVNDEGGCIGGGAWRNRIWGSRVTCVASYIASGLFARV